MYLCKYYKATALSGLINLLKVFNFFLYSVKVSVLLRARECIGRDDYGVSNILLVIESVS